ncbi:MAG: sulfotransferase [Pirellulales bacterium]|nr:sulfotransferase [Pirellulales bacterium]
MAKPQSSPPSSIRPSAMSWWAPRYWVGANFSGWTRELAVNRFAVSPTRAHMAVAGTIYSVFNSSLGVLENLIYRSRVAATPITHEPIFILGHWRCGTTLLHELLILDPEHASPNTWQCFAANHFLLSEQIGKKLLWFMLPAQRPMDNMPLGWDNPQEDEFALCNLGIPSPYLSILFPNAPPRYPQYLDLAGLSAEELDRWKGTLHRFLQRVSYRERKRLVLKSPPHTARVKTLLELFPDARFVHMVRDPEVLFASTMHLWKSLYESQGLQRPSFDGLEEHVFETFNRLHQKFQEERALIAPNRLCEMRYEDLVNAPLPQLDALYAQLELGDFKRARPRVEQYFNREKNYKTNRYELDDARRAEIRERWGDYLKTHGYERTRDGC